MRWIATTAGLMLAITLGVGCSQQCSLPEDTFYEVHRLPKELEKDPHAGSAPISPATPTPPDVDFPERAPKYLSLAEAFAIAMENGAPSGRGGAAQGIVDNNLVSFQGAGL